MVGHSHISFTLLSVKDLMLFQYSVLQYNRPFKSCALGTDRSHYKANVSVKKHYYFCVIKLVTS
jgi:hypothetical protein